VERHDNDDDNDETMTATSTQTNTVIATTTLTSTVTEDDDDDDDKGNTTETTMPEVTPCENNHDFRDEFGYKCWFWAYYFCDDAESWWGYSPNGQAELFANCPEACGTCRPTVTTAPSCRNTPGFFDEHGFGCHAWRDSVCTDAEEGWGYSPRGQMELIANCPVACGTCEPEETPCEDTPGFIDERGWRCRRWRFNNCENAESRWGYSPAGEIEILNNCPSSCGLCDGGRRSRQHRRHLR